MKFLKELMNAAANLVWTVLALVMIYGVSYAYVVLGASPDGSVNRVFENMVLFTAFYLGIKALMEKVGADAQENVDEDTNYNPNPEPPTAPPYRNWVDD